MADKVKKRYLFPEDFMADPSVHVFDGKLYIYPSHDWESAAPDDDFGSEYDMKDYHVLSLEGPDPMTSPVKDNGVALDIKDVPWARRQLWDNEVVKGRDGKYYMYFPAKDKTDIFRCGVAVSDSPTGPFKAMPDPIRGSYSIDYAILHDDADDEYYMYRSSSWTRTEPRSRWKTTSAASSRPAGCTSTTESTTSATPPATRTSCATPSATTLTARSPTRA